MADSADSSDKDPNSRFIKPDFSQTPSNNSGGSAIYQRDIRSKLEDLRDTLNVSNVKWNKWEREFIESVTLKLEHMSINLSPKQYDNVMNLWERI